MQRKRHINFKLHSIPILLNMKKDASYNDNSSKKSNVLYSIPCVDRLKYITADSNLNHSVWLHSLDRTFELYPQAMIQTCASHKLMTSCSRISSWCVYISAFLLMGISSILFNTFFNNYFCSAASASLTIATPHMTSSAVTPGNTATTSTNVSVSVSDAASYSLSLKVDNTTLTGGSTAITGGDVTADNTWGYKWDDASTYIAPSTNAQALAVPALSNNAASFTKKLTFGAKFASTAEAGTYSAKGTISLVATPLTTTYTISYNANGGSNVPADTTCTAQGLAGTSCSAVLSSAKPTKTNYTFLGWADSSSATTKQYDAGGIITINGNKTIFAVWQFNESSITGFGGIKKMQDMTTSICNNVSISTSGQLYDTRDESIYTIVKMTYGKCWMTSNLRIVNKTISSTDSDMASGSFFIPASSKTGFNYGDNTAISAFLPTTSDVPSEADANVITNTGYYTWCTATAGTCSSATTNGANAAASICPKGWKLPSGGSSGEFQAFANAEDIANSSTGSTKIRGMPYNFAYTGFMGSKGLQNASSNGDWWSRTAVNSATAYPLSISNQGVYPGIIDVASVRSNGYAVRCVAQ